jgi:hypothetical protein
MGKLTRKEQTLLSYYIYNFLEDSEGAMTELEQALNASEEFATINEELKGKGMLNDTKEDGKQRITNEGILHIDNILHIQSDAVERNKLAYIKNSLLINELELSEDPLKEYIHKQVGIE